MVLQGSVCHCVWDWADDFLLLSQRPSVFPDLGYPDLVRILPNPPLGRV